MRAAPAGYNVGVQMARAKTSRWVPKAETNQSPAGSFGSYTLSIANPNGRNRQVSEVPAIRPRHIGDAKSRRIKALLRRGPVDRSSVLRISDLELDRVGHQVRRRERTIDLTSK